MALDSRIELCKPNEKPLDVILRDGGYTAIFRKIAVVGDSLSSGEFVSKKDGKYTCHDMYEYSWGQFLARMCGSTVYNFSRGGMKASEYCTSFAENNRYWDPQYAAQAYIIALGLNDLYRGEEVGSVDDVDFDDYRNNKPTFAGYYAQIIQRYKEIQPRAKFFLMTVPRDPVARQVEAHREVIYALAEKFDNTYVLDFNQYAPEYDREFKKNFYLDTHMNPMGYLLTARMVASYIDYIIRHNPVDFKDIGFIGTDLFGDCLAIQEPEPIETEEK